MARKKKTVRKDHRIAFRVSADELFKLTAKATRAGTTVGDFARKKALAGLVRKTRSIAVAEMPFDAATFSELRRLGVNLNQMMKHCHTFQVPPPDGLAPLLDEVRRVLNGVLTARAR